MTTTTTVKAELINEFDEPSILVYTDDRTAAVEGARRCFAAEGYDDEADGPLTAGEPRLWRWIPSRWSEYPRLLHAWDAPGRGAFIAVEVRIGGAP